MIFYSGKRRKKENQSNADGPQLADAVGNGTVYQLEKSVRDGIGGYQQPGRRLADHQIIGNGRQKRRDGTVVGVDQKPGDAERP